MSKFQVVTPSDGQSEPIPGSFWVQSPADHVELYAHYWEPTKKTTKIRANVTFIHGLGEHIMRYDHVFKRFSEKGIRVFAFDQRGFGKTVQKNSLSVEGGKSNAMVLGDNQGWDIAMNDILCAYNFSHQEGVPHFLMGHSMGGLLTIAAATMFKNDIKLNGVITSAPALRPGFPVRTLKRVVGSFLSKFLGSFNISTGVDPDGISRDNQVVLDYKKDPLVHGMGSLRTLAALLDQGEHIMNDGWKDYDENVPFLMMFGTKDTLTNFSSGQEFVQKLQCQDKTFRDWDGLYHELHNEPEKDQVIKEYIDWILAHL